MDYKKSKIAGGRVGIYVPEHPKANNRGYVLRSRHVVEQQLGRYLTKDEEVHHKDGDKLNDVEENLEVLSKEIHGAKHGVERRRLDYDVIKTLCFQEGFGYKRIARITGYSLDSVKSALRKIKTGHF